MSLIITDAGRAAAIRAADLGIEYKIAEISIGTEGYTPTKDQTALRAEVARKVITRGEVVGISTLHFETVWDGEEEFEGKELGYWLDEGTLFAVDSRDGEVITYKRKDSVVTESCELDLSASTIDSISVELVGVPDATLSRKGIVQLSNSYGSTSEEKATTEKALRDGLGTKLSRTAKATMTDNDGKGNANSTYNHNAGVPQQDGSSGRITVDTDMPTAAMRLQLADDAEEGVPIDLKTILELKTDKANSNVALTEFGQRVFSPGNIAATLAAIYPCGAPIPWPISTVPTGYLECRGQSFNKTTYPELAKAYPSGVLPDMRGEFIRGWDNGRGVDSGRTIQSSQGSQNLAHSHVQLSVVTNRYPNSSQSFQSAAGAALGIGDTPTELSGGGESRPRNIAYMYIVRAA